MALASRTGSGGRELDGAEIAVIIAWPKLLTEAAISERAAAPGLARPRFETGGVAATGAASALRFKEGRGAS